MFLNELNDKEKVAFINLVDLLAKVDDVFAKEEEELIEEYLQEFSLSKDVIGTLNNDEIIDTFKDSSERSKKIVCFELVLLALVDGEYGDKELEFLNNITAKLNVSANQKKAMENYAVSFKEIYDFSVVDAESKIELLKEQAEDILSI